MAQTATEKAIDALALTDNDIARALANYGYPADRSLPQGFETLAKIIIGQQISRHAASSNWQRLKDAEMTSAEAITGQSLDKLKSYGLSRPKASYLRGLAEAVTGGDLDFDILATLPFDEVRERLVSFKGVGNWTADNYRLFALHDMDAWPGNDIALQEAMKRLKSLSHRPSASDMEALAKDWAPYRGAGALFLWHLYAIEVREARAAAI